jgi:hypothetical protein
MVRLEELRGNGAGVTTQISAGGSLARRVQSERFGVLDAGRGGFKGGHYDAEHGEREQLKQSTELLEQGVIKKLKATASSILSPGPVASSTSTSTKAETRRRRRSGRPLRAGDTANSETV